MDCEDGIIIEANCHRSKVYYIRKLVNAEIVDGEIVGGDIVDVMKAKGLPIKPTREEYVKVLFEPKTTVSTSYQEIAKKDFILYTREVKKTGLTALNDKLLVKNCRLHAGKWTFSCYICQVKWVF